MRTLTTLLLFGVLAVVPARSEAQTSIESLLGLQAAGFSDELLIATFQSDGTVYYLTADDLIALRDRGLSERVLVAMLATRRAAPAVQPVRLEAAPRPEPVVVEVTQQVDQRVEVEAPRVETPRTVYVPVPVLPVVRPPEKPAPEPLYWGFGGRPRPGPVNGTSSSGGGGGR